MTIGRWMLAGAAMLAAGATAAPPHTVVLIGGDAPHNPNVHDARAVVERLRLALLSSPDVRRQRLTIAAYPNGWPSDPAAFARAATIVWYFDGLERHPLLDPDRRALFAGLMARGVGLVSLHQSFTLPPGDHAVPLAGWLGAERGGMVDRTVERAGFTVARHPVANGLTPFACRDEFYPSLAFAPAGVTPVLSADVHRENAPADPPSRRTLAWAYERPGGGRSFGYSGIHYLDTLDHEEPRRMILNAIVWSAGLRVPPGGIRSTVTWTVSPPSAGEPRCGAR